MLEVTYMGGQEKPPLGAKIGKIRSKTCKNSGQKSLQKLPPELGYILRCS